MKTLGKKPLFYCLTLTIELLLSMHASGLVAQTPATSVAAVKPYVAPAMLINDWRTQGIDSLILSKARKTLATAKTALITAAGSNAKSMTDLAKRDNKTVTLNMKRITDRIISVDPSEKLPVPVIVEPVWCALADQYVMFVTISRSDNNELLGSAHKAINRDDLEKSLKNNADLITTELPGLFATAAAAARKQSAKKSDALHIGLSPAIPEGHYKKGSSQCLNFLTEELLAKDYTVARSVGADRLASIRSVYDLEAQIRRPTRLFVMQWQHPDERKPQVKLPMTLKLKTEMAESVFGHSIPPKFRGEVNLSLASDRTITLDLKPEFKTLFSAEKKSLLLADWPQVSKIYGAWVYLDRGRAWGLKMNDRLVAMVNGEAVKGHVVRFFGPEQKLTSPRGFPIEEGAILFIRKGQKLPTTGLEFQFDPRTFPTEYPIPPGK